MDFETLWKSVPANIRAGTSKEVARNFVNMVSAHYENILTKVGVCSDCGEMYSHSLDEPIANCKCKQAEWYTLTPYMQLEQRCKQLYLLCKANNCLPENGYEPIAPKCD